MINILLFPIGLLNDTQLVTKYKEKGGESRVIIDRALYNIEAIIK